MASAPCRWSDCQPVAQIPGPVLRRRYVRQHRAARMIAAQLRVAEEEQFVLDNAPADRTAELALVRGGRIDPRRQRRVVRKRVEAEIVEARRIDIDVLKCVAVKR